VEVSRIASFTDDREWAAESLAGTRVYLFSGLGDNRYFRHTARNLGVGVAGHAEFPDHHWYQAVELAAVMESAVAAGAKALMTSAKDAVRLEIIRDRLAAIPDILIIKANQVIYNENPLTDSLDRLLEGG
jgi:tetraacyldisaccharide-1-P 4'-kinase